MAELRQTARDEMGVLRAVNERGVSFTYEREWPHALFEEGHGGTAAKNLRTVSKGSSRGVGPQKKQGRVRGNGGAADKVEMCRHGNKAVHCSSCRAWHCGCPGSPAHHCEGHHG